MQSERFRLSRLTGDGWYGFLSSLFISSLCYGLGLALLFPYVDMSARTISFPFVWFWGWRYGIRGGFAAGLLVDVVLADSVSWLAELPRSQYDRVWMYIINNCLIGTLAGVMSELSVRLRNELEQRNHVEGQLKDSKDGYRLLFDSNPNPMWVCDPETERFLAVNKAAIKHYGYSSDEFAEMSMARIRVPDADEPPFFLSHSRSNWTSRGDSRHVRSDGSTIEVEVSAHDLTFHGRGARLYLITDISERKRAQAALEHQALHDGLTGLPNRTSLSNHLAHTVAVAERTSQSFALLALDLDRFKEINDSLGHHYGDLVLNQVSTRFREVLRSSDILARFGGDEFALLLPATDEAGAITTARRLLSALEVPFLVDGLPITVGVSIGVAVYPRHGTCSHELLQHADIAMYGAKRSRCEVMTYAAERNEFSPQKQALASELRQGIDGDQLLLHYQPQIDLRTNRIAGAEALVRWPHPRDGMLAPAQFVPLAEHTGLIKSLSLWVLETALLQCRLWRRSGLNLDVAVNLSPTSLKDDNLATTIERLLNNADAVPSWLTLELTESAVLADPEAARSTLTRLRALGVKISIDDFGTGQSSLAYLKDYPIDEIKIDQSFIQGINSEGGAATTVQSIIELGSRLNCRVVAEGIEDQAALDRLNELGCHAAQGFFLGRPRPAHELTKRLNAQIADRRRRASDHTGSTASRREKQHDPV